MKDPAPLLIIVAFPAVELLKNCVEVPTPLLVMTVESAVAAFVKIVRPMRTAPPDVELLLLIV